MTVSSPGRTAPLALWLAETIHLSEERWGPYDDTEIARAIRHQPHTPTSAVVARNQALAQREGLDQIALRWRDNALLLGALAVLAAIVSGSGGALAALGDGRTPVNLFWALGGLLGLNLLALLAWLLGMVWGQRLGGVLGRLVLAGASRISRLPVLAAAGERAAAARPPAAALVPRALLDLLRRAALLRGLSGLASHGWWLLALLSAFATLLALLSARRYGFVWETTLLQPETFVVLTRTLGWLPSLLGFPLPDAALVRASDGLHPLAPQAQAIWSGWLLGCVLVYGIAPRLLALALCGGIVLRRRHRLGLDMTRPEMALLRDRLMPASERLGVTQAAPHACPAPRQASEFAFDSAATDALAARLALRAAGGAAPILVGIDWPDDIDWPPFALPGQVLDAGSIETREQRNALLEHLTRQPPSGLLIICDSTQTPDRGSVSLVAELARIAPGHARVLLHGAADSIRHAQWRERLGAAGLTPDHLYDTPQQALAWLADSALSAGEASHA